MVQSIHAKRQEKYGMTSFQLKYLLTGLLFCGNAMQGIIKRIREGTNITPVIPDQNKIRKW